MILAEMERRETRVRKQDTHTREGRTRATPVRTPLENKNKIFIKDRVTCHASAPAMAKVGWQRCNQDSKPRKRPGYVVPTSYTSIYLNTCTFLHHFISDDRTSGFRHIVRDDQTSPSQKRRRHRSRDLTSWQSQIFNRTYQIWTRFRGSTARRTRSAFKPWIHQPN